jgi:protocatechuate 3,4-dioxygenase beta subunit
MVGVATAIADAQGVYRFPALPPGTYELTATLQGFAPTGTRAWPPSSDSCSRSC